MSLCVDHNLLIKVYQFVDHNLSLSMNILIIIYQYLSKVLRRRNDYQSTEEEEDFTIFFVNY